MTMLSSGQKTYVLGEPLGKGASGVVYLASMEDASGIKQVVLKIVSEASKRKNALREVEVLQHLPLHKNLVRYIDSFPTKTGVCIVLEYVANTRNLTKYTPVNEVALLDVMYQLTDAVEALHSSQILHCDIKPENILMKDNIPILIDFDSACLQNESYGYAKCGETMRGTPYYIAPEVWVSTQRYTPAADIYSLGVTFYYLASKRSRPYTITTVDELKALVVDTTAKPNPLAYRFPGSKGETTLATLIGKMMDKSRFTRATLDMVKAELSSMIKSA